MAETGGGGTMTRSKGNGFPLGRKGSYGLWVPTLDEKEEKGPLASVEVEDGVEPGIRQAKKGTVRRAAAHRRKG